MACTCTVRLMHVYSETDACLFLVCILWTEDTLTSTVHTECSRSMQMEHLFDLDYQHVNAGNLFLPEYYFQEGSGGQGNTCYFTTVLVFPPSWIYSVFCWSLMKLLVCINYTWSLLTCENLRVRFTPVQEDIYLQDWSICFYAYVAYVSKCRACDLARNMKICNYISIVQICN